MKETDTSSVNLKAFANEILLGHNYHLNHKFMSSIDEFHLFYSSTKSRGSEFIFNLIQPNANKGTSFSHVITIIMEQIELVAKKINIPSTLLWMQPTTIFNICYYRFKDY
ncbi:hypothetical protein H5410_050169 [Solanum commersonii]|uniref:Uncharacterized protein n=1 Tax=Solanum commersonii TaxID=4109 RepID=A0A9J5WX70_SOLCO|nr:hypothetical protein H5410_050169 [Solanum commersonii]